MLFGINDKMAALLLMFVGTGAVSAAIIEENGYARRTRCRNAERRQGTSRTGVVMHAACIVEGGMQVSCCRG